MEMTPWRFVHRAGTVMPSEAGDVTGGKWALGLFGGVVLSAHGWKFKPRTEDTTRRR